MKLNLSFLLSIGIAAASVSFIASTGNKKSVSEKKNQARGEGMEDDAGGRYAWELKRLADPATGKIPDNIRQMELAYAATLPNDAQSDSRSTPLNIVNRGPWNLGGRTRAFSIDVNNENRLLAGSTSGGMWLSTNGGATWAESNTLSQLKSASCLVQDTRPTHTNVWYYGSGEAYGTSASGGSAFYLGDGIFKSIDNGTTWQALASTSSGNPNSFSNLFQLVWNVAIDESTPDSITEIYAATHSAIYRSTNGGTTWASVRNGNSYFTDVAVSPTGVVYATLSDDGTQKGIWRSTNGTAFTNIIPTTFPTAYNRIVMGINPNNENEVYFLANTPGFGKVTYDFLGDPHWNSLWKYTYLSGNGDSAGGTWQDLSINLPASGDMFDKFQTQESYDMLVKVKPGNSNVVFIGGTNLYRSTTAFQDSTHTTYIGGYLEHSHLPVIAGYANHHPDQHCLFFSPSNPDVMYSSNDGGIYKTNNNTDSTVVWQSLNNGYLTSMFYTVAIDHATPNNNIIIGGAQDNGSWYTNSASSTAPWIQPRGGDGSYCAIADNQTNYYFSIQNAKMMKATLDAGGNITSFARIDPIGLKQPQFINPFALDPNNNNLMYVLSRRFLWRNDDLSGIPMVGNWDSISTNWTRFNDSIPVADSSITALAVCKTPANRVYYGTERKRVYRIDNANTGSPTPVDITSTTASALFPAAGYVSCIAVDPRDGNKLMVVFSNYNVYSIFYSSDAGATWAKAGGNLDANNISSPSIRWASIMPVADGTVFLVAASTGLYATDTLLGTNTVWVQQGANTIGNAVCDMIDFRQSDGLAVIATHANGIYSTHITSVNDITTINEITASKSDLQLINYPNPFTSNTTIEFVLNQRSKVNLQIFDEYGRTIQTLANEFIQQGKHTFIFENKNLSAGVYYCSLNTDTRKKTIKMIIVK